MVAWSSDEVTKMNWMSGWGGGQVQDDMFTWQLASAPFPSLARPLWRAATLEELMGLVEPPPQSPSVFLDLHPTPHQEDGVPASVQQRQQEAMALEHISRMLMEEDDDMDGRFMCPDHPALLHAQQSLAHIISASSSSSNNGTTTKLYKDNALAAGAEHCSSMDLLNMAFRLRGMEEASKLLPRDDRLVTINPEPQVAFVRGQANTEDGMLSEGVRLLNKNMNGQHGLETDADTGRASKLMAVAGPEEEAGVHEMIARMMLNDCEISTQEMEDLRAAMVDEALRNNTREARRRKLQVDMRTLLVHCAQAVDDRRGARELLKQAKQHASPTGDAAQRLAHCFVAALEARLAGTGSLVHRSVMANRTSAEFLKAYQLFRATCCFEKVAFTFSNMTIYGAVAGRSRLHIVDYGVYLGFQWPGLLRWLAAREGGPPEVTITGIDLPRPGFRPASHIEAAGHGLSSYARELGVPFKFHAIAAAKWDAIRVEDLRIDPDAVLVVNSVFKLETLVDDSVVVDSPSPRDRVLGSIRSMRPAVFTHGVVNGFYGNTFLTRFREALFYYSGVFDVLDATMPRGSQQRLVLERDVLGRAALNVIACEGVDLKDHPEKYRQWQARNQRAGLKQLPLKQDMVNLLKDKVGKYHHKDFFVCEDGQWLLQGWMGRVLFAHSTWVAEEMKL